MTRLDYYWLSNKDWWHRTSSGMRVLNDDAPIEAKKSYKRYLKQLKEATKRGSL